MSEARDRLAEVMARGCAAACGQKFDGFDRVGKAAWIRHQKAAIDAAKKEGWKIHSSGGEEV